MTRHSDEVCLRQMLDHSQEAADLTAGATRDVLDADRVLCLALIQLLQIVGEAGNRVSQSFRDAHPEIPWPQIVALRNRLIHGYDTIDLDIVWQILTVDVPGLIAALAAIAPPDDDDAAVDNDNA
jgi:uncharacterized protein with HEPN domain